MQIASKSVQDKLALEANDFQMIQKEISRSMHSRRQFVQQFSENDMVMKELERIDDEENGVYKLIGPVLIRQDIVEAKNNVGKRLNFIRNETVRIDKLLKVFEIKQETKHKEILELQKKLYSNCAE
mmetsp:Transcript_13394/g.48035  ORF Transcript_13394/g.48035 Transcript_13394/m.48035 type:complete len:126 (-) Transcript_13394:2176-2553(-)|eukprot:31471-Pelagococcus_subviridis.AAC.34